LMQELWYWGEGGMFAYRIKAQRRMRVEVERMWSCCQLTTKRKDIWAEENSSMWKMFKKFSKLYNAPNLALTRAPFRWHSLQFTPPLWLHQLWRPLLQTLLKCLRNIIPKY
jgi:hypothetical protein